MEYHSKDYIVRKYDDLRSCGNTYALIHMNIKNFRFYNTKYGVEEGDTLLALVYERLSGLLEEGEYIAHLYADNFVALIKCVDSHHMINERMLHIIDSIYRIEDERIYRNLFLSFGIYQIADRKIPFDSALNLANLCRKESKTLNNRSFCYEIYDESYYKSYMERIELETKTANAYKNYEFIPYVQPKVDLKTEKIVGAEALLRWIDKNGSIVPLYKFLPILNQNGYIQLIDLDIFEQMCLHFSKRIEAGKKVVPISFNISKAYFYNPNMIQDYINILEKYKIPKRLIEFELMESISLDNMDMMTKVVNSMKECGFTCSLDDFGNGYSSFNVLLNANLDIIKMDRQFFLNNINGDSKLVIKTVVDLIHSLGMKVVAEGVESAEHIAWLKESDCEMVQGYYYFRPMPVDDFEKLLDTQEEKGKTEG